MYYGNPYIFLVCGLFIILAFIPSMFRSVRQNTVKIIERFGKFNRVLETGLNFVVPGLDRTVATINLALQNLHEAVDAVTKRQGCSEN